MWHPLHYPKLHLVFIINIPYLANYFPQDSGPCLCISDFVLCFKILNVFHPISIFLFPPGDIFDQLIRSHLGGFHPFIGKYVSLSRPERFDLAAGTKLSNWNWRKFQMWRDCIDCPIEKVLQVDQDEYCSFRDKKRQMLSKAGIWRRMANVSDLPSLSANSTATKRRHL